MERRRFDLSPYNIQGPVPLATVTSILKGVKGVSETMDITFFELINLILKANKLPFEPYMPAQPETHYPADLNCAFHAFLMRLNIATMGSRYTEDIAGGHMYAPSLNEVLSFMIKYSKTSHYGDRLPEDIIALNNYGFNIGLDETGMKEKLLYLKAIGEKGPYMKRNVQKAIKHTLHEEEELITAMEQYLCVKVPRSAVGTEKVPLESKLFPNLRINLLHIRIPLRSLETCWFLLEVIPEDQTILARPTLIVAIRGSRMWFDWMLDGIIDTVAFPPGIDDDTSRAHMGMVRSACLTANELIPVLDEYPDHDILVTGHSYGAGVSSLLAPLLKQVYPKQNIRAVSYATPANTSLKLSQALVPYVTTVIFETDLVPRLGVYPVGRMLKGLKKIEKELPIDDKRALVPAGRILYIRFDGDIRSFPETDGLTDPHKFVYDPKRDYHLRVADVTENVARIEALPHDMALWNHDLSNYWRAFEQLKIFT